MSVIFLITIAFYLGNPSINETKSSSNVQFVGAWSFGSECRAVAANDTLVYMGAGGGVFILNTRNVNNPIKIGEIATRGFVWNMVYEGGNLYIAEGNNGIEVWNVQNPGSPNLVSWLNVNADVRKLFIQGNYLFAASRDSGLKIFEISNPSHLQEIVSYSIGSWPLYDIFVDSIYLYAAFGLGGLRVLNISNASQPFEIDSISLPDTIFSVYVKGNFAYVADGYFGGLRIINVSRPDSVYEVGHFYTTGNAQKIIVKDSLAYVLVGSQGGLRIIDISNPANPHRIGYYDTQGTAVDIVITNQTAFIADGSRGLLILNIGNPSNPHYIKYFETPGVVKKVVVDSSYAYVISGNEIRIIDIREVSHPREISFISPISYEYTRDIFLNHGYLYCTSYEHLINIDVRDPYTPGIISRLYTGCCNTNYSVYIDSNYAYLGGDTAITTVDVSTPNNLQLVGGVSTDYRPIFSIFKKSRYLYGLSRYRLYIINSANPVHPRIIYNYQFSSCCSGFYGEDLFVLYPYAYIAGDSGGVKIIDISDTMNFHTLSTFDTDGEANAIYVSNGYAYVADGYDGLRILDVSDPSHPVEVGYYDTPGYARDVFVRGKYVFVADDIAGLQIYFFCSDSVTIDSKNAIPGEEIVIPVRLVHREIVSGIQTCLVYDTTVLHYRTSSVDSSLSNFSLNVNRVGDSLKFVLVSLGGDTILPGVDTLFYVYFDVDSSVEVGDSTYIFLTNSVLSDPQANQLDATNGSAWIYIRGNKGDLNLDGEINVTDVVRIINIILRKPPNPSNYELWAADMNNDGNINVADVVLAINVIIGREKFYGNLDKEFIANAWIEQNKLFIKSNISVAALQFDLLGRIDEFSLNPSFKNMQVFSNNIPNGKRLIILNLKGVLLPSGVNDILFINGEDIKLKNVILVDENGQILEPSKANVFELVNLEPNPVIFGKLKGQILVNKPGNFYVKIINIAGRVHKNLRFYFKKGRQNFNIDLSKLTPGVYFVEIVSRKNRVVEKIVVRNNRR